MRVLQVLLMQIGLGGMIFKAGLSPRGLLILQKAWSETSREVDVL